MRALYIVPAWPHGRSFGGQLRALHIGRALQALGDVTIAVVSADGPEAGAVARTNGEFDLHGHVRVEATQKRLADRLAWYCNPRFMNVHGCVANPDDRRRLLNRLAEFDLIWVLNSRTPNILQQWHWPGAVLDLDDVPSTFHRSVSHSATSAGAQLKARIHAHISARRERLWRDRFDALCVCSETDRQQLGGEPNVHVVPNGFARPDREPVRSPATPPRIGFIGLFNYAPNLDGMRWFAEHCWPKIKAQVPDARLRLIGKETDGPNKPGGADIDALGWVADPADEIATWSAMIIPVRTGAGTRIKIAEAFSRKCPVVSTTHGAYGYNVQHARELLLADEPADFASSCVALMNNPGQGACMADVAWTRFLTEWSWDAIAPRVHAAAEIVLARRGARLRNSEVGC